MLHKAVVILLITIIFQARRAAPQNTREGLRQSCRIASKDETVPCDGGLPPKAPLDKPFVFLAETSLSDGSTSCSYHYFRVNQIQEWREWRDESFHCAFVTVPKCITVTITLYKVESNGTLTWLEERQKAGEAAALPSVRDLRVTVESNSLRVSWRNPGGLCPDTCYILHFSGISTKSGRLHAGEQKIPVNQSIRNDFIIRNVLANADYKICVSAESEAAKNSYICTELLASDLVPRAPQNLTVLKTTSSSAILTWSPPENANISLKYVISWALCARQNSAQDLSALNTRATSTLLESRHDFTYNISGLSAGAKYCISIQALNFLGFGATAEVEFRTKGSIESGSNAFLYVSVAVLVPLVVLVLVLCFLNWLCRTRIRDSSPVASDINKSQKSGQYSAVRLSGRFGEEPAAGGGSTSSSASDDNDLSDERRSNSRPQGRDGTLRDQRQFVRLLERRRAKSSTAALDCAPAVHSL